MVSKWTEFPLEEVIETFIDYRGKTPKKTESGIPLITAKVIKNGFIQQPNEFISEDDYDTWMTRGIPKKGDVVLTTEAPLGEVAQIINDKKIALAQRVITLRGKENILNNTFLKYTLQSSVVQHRLQQRASGSTVSGIKSAELKKVMVPIPKIEVQRQIVKILGKIDFKIIINRNMITNLESLSGLLFKRWFIDFEFPNEQELPYYSSGGEVVESELGEIPKQWSVSSINDLGEIIGGGTPSKKQEEYYTVDGIPWITPKDLSNNKSKFIYKGNQDISELGLSKSSAKIMPEGTVLFSSRAPIGYIAIAGTEVTTNQGFKSLVPNKGYSEYFIYFKLKEILPIIEANAGGSTFKEISASGLKAIQIVLPDKDVVKKFNETIIPLFEQIKNLELQMENLISIRDSLLPKLLSGEIEILEESVVES